MAKRDLAEVLEGRKEFSRRLLIRRRSMAQLSRAQRLAAAPREPRGPSLQYLRFQRALVAEMRALVMAQVEPILAELVSNDPVTGLQVAPAKDSTPTLRIDSCAVCGPPPSWYAALLTGPLRTRQDAPGGRWNQILGFLEVAITELVGQRRIAPKLADIATAIWGHNRVEMSRVLQIDLRRQDVGLQDFIQRFIEKNIRLIRSVATDQLDRMENVVAKATAGQVRVETLRDQILSTFNVTESRAALIARDQTLKSNADLIQLRQQQVGVTEYIWTSSKDERVRGRPGGKWAKSQSDHWSLDGTRQSWLVEPITNPVTGERNHPGRDYQCRCTATPIVDHLLVG